MYNGVGLQTPRGSGGSGYVQKNLSTNTQFKKQNNQQFLRQLEQKRKAHLTTHKKANPQIVQHERKRQILIHTIKLRQKLIKQGVDEQQIEKNIKKAQTILKEKLQKGQILTKAKQTHILTQEKERQYARLSKAFGLKADDKIGSAFDFQGMKQARLKRLEEKRVSQKFVCPHQDCGKGYPVKQLLDRHLKYKHPKIQSIEPARKSQKP